MPKLTLFATGLNTPWGMKFLPDGRLLVTQKGGTLVLVSADGATISAPITGVPAVDANGQGGLLDVALDPAFNLASNRRIYLAYSEPGSGGTNGTAVARADLNAALTALDNVTVIFQQMPKKVSQGHYGSRIIFRTDGTMFVTLGERQMPINATNEAQSLTSQLGKVVRINTDGSIPADNPYATDAEPLTRPVWSYGHRNPQAAALHPATGDLWVTEHGPQGGDEVNLSLPKRNFGWAIVSYGCNYGDPSAQVAASAAASTTRPTRRRSPSGIRRRPRLAAQCSIPEADSRNGKEIYLSGVWPERRCTASCSTREIPRSLDRSPSSPASTRYAI